MVRYFIEKIDDKYPFAFIDIGAMGGIPSKWNEILNIMQIIAFEPDTREFSKLRNSNNIKYINCALYGRSEDLQYYIAKESGKSSVLKPNKNFLSQYEDAERFRTVKKEYIPSTRVKSLDFVIEEDSILDVDFIKLDTQGSELSILQGGRKRVMPQIFGAQIEVEFLEMYEKQPLFRHIDEFMDSNRFVLMDLRRHYWKRKDYYAYSGKGQLIFGDALYFKKIDAFYAELSDSKDRFYIRSKIFKSILTCMVYKIFDYAIALARTGFDKRHLTHDEYKQTVLEIKKYSLRGIPLKFRFNSKLYNGIISILQKFKPRSYLGWAGSDQEIGNIKDT